MLWTIMPPEVLINTDLKPPSQKIVNYQGVPLLVENISPNQYKIKQILSTNPNDYLIDSLQPDTCLSLELNTRIN